MILFPLFFVNLSVFHLELQDYFKSKVYWTVTKNVTHAKHVSKTGKIDPGDRVTLPV